MNQQTSRPPLTRKQTKFMNELKEFMSEIEHCPTYEEIGEALDTPKTNVFRYFVLLEKKGYLRRYQPSGFKLL